MIIPIDFVAGTHGNFLEIALNHAAGFVNVDFNPFNNLGASHRKTATYNKNKVFVAQHWFEKQCESLKHFDKAVSIRFSCDDLLLVSSISMLRAGDRKIHSDTLEFDSVKQLDNDSYRTSVLEKIYKSYPFLSTEDPNIPRYVLREFYKFGFSSPESNGYWIKQQEMQSCSPKNVFVWNLQNFYNWDSFYKTILEVGQYIDIKINPESVKPMFDLFIKQVPFLDHKEQCDKIINAIIQKHLIPIPNLTLFQESYINGNLEKIFNKEMPFHQDSYFTNTKDVLYYINN